MIFYDIVSEMSWFPIVDYSIFRNTIYTKYKRTKFDFVSIATN